MKDDTLRALIRLMPPARALKEDLEKSLHLETWPGTGDAAVRMVQGLQRSTAALTDDAYVQSLEIAPAAGALDKEKVATAALAAGQLLAFLEGQTGLAGFGGGGNKSTIQTAPNINIGGSRIATTAGVMKRLLGDTEAQDEEGEEGE